MTSFSNFSTVLFKVLDKLQELWLKLDKILGGTPKEEPVFDESAYDAYIKDEPVYDDEVEEIIEDKEERYE